MDLYLKSFATFRTVARYTALSWALVTDSLDYETSTVTVAGDRPDVFASAAREMGASRRTRSNSSVALRSLPDCRDASA